MAGGFNPQISPPPWGSGTPIIFHLTQCVIGPRKCTCQMTCKSVERFKQGARMCQTTDRQTTDDEEMSRLAMCEIACARAISPKSS